MPYASSRTLPAEHASRLGHLEVVKSPLVKRICESFEDPQASPTPRAVTWLPIEAACEPLPLVFAVDGSLQVIRNDQPPHRELAFVKTALLRIDRPALDRLDLQEPHPFALRDILTEAALYHATALPLRHISVSGYSVYNLVRETIFQSFRDDLNGEVLETLKWLVYEKWSGKGKSLSPSECPHCGGWATLPHDAAEGKCPACGGHLFVTDWLGFHRDMAPDSASDVVVKSYMAIHEALLLFTGIRYYWETQREVLRRAFFLKDGPLAFFSQFGKLVNPVRSFLAYACSLDYPIAIVGQEKSGRFLDHLQIIGSTAPEMSFFIPDDEYIKSEVQHRPLGGNAYGEDTNYGAKVFVRLQRDDLLVLNIATGQFVPSPSADDLMAAEMIFATLPTLVSARYTGALQPIVLANDVASLSTYPSAQILKLFADSAIERRSPAMQSAYAAGG